ncbi:MAG: SCO family protein [Sphingomonas sp.]
MNEIARTIAALALAIFAVACSPAAAPPGKAPLAGAKIGGPFTLIDQNGRTISERSFAGKYRIVYFGYTFCPDVCPIDAQNIGQGLRLVEKADPALGARIVPLFITVDPARDTPAVLKSFVSAFHPHMIGLTGSDAAIAATAKEFAISYQKADPGPGGGYMVQHTSVGYLMDPQGKPLALLPVEQNPQAVADEIRRWAR